MVTLTGTTSMSGDFIVMQDVSGNEKAYIDYNGTIVSNALSSSAVTSAFNVSVTSTGTCAATEFNRIGYLVTASSKAVVGSVIGYNSGHTDEVSTCNYFFSVYGSKAPTYFLGVGSSSPGAGNPTTNGFVVAAKTFATFPTSATAVVGLKCLFGDSVWYSPAWSSAAFT